METNKILEMKRTTENELKRRLSFKNSNGFFNYGRIPYAVYYELDASEDENLNERKPGHFMVTPNLGDHNYSLSIWIYENVPKNYKDIVMYHELVEAELQIVFGLSEKDAHEKSSVMTKTYAEKYLSENEFATFLKWHETLFNHHPSP